MKLERGIAALSGVEHASVNFAAATLEVDYEPDLLAEKDIVGRVEALGYGVSTDEGEAARAAAASGRPAARALPVGLGSVIAAAALTAAGWVTGMLLVPTTTVPSWTPLALYLAAIVAGGYPIARRALAAVALRTLDMNVLMTTAVIGATLIGQASEGAAVVVLFALGNALENRALQRARRGLRELMSLAPMTATVKRDGQESVVPLAAVAIGDLVLVRPGERVPTDGVVREGASAVEEAPITGEPLPVAKESGDTVWAGSLNGSGFLAIEATTAAKDNTIAKITHLIEEAQARRAPVEQTVERFSRYYTPAVMGLALAIAIVPPLMGEPLLESIRRALVMLVIACPCALVISTPVSIVSAMSAASRGGVLVKGGRYLEAMSHVKVVALDKTGTVTTGHPIVEEVRPLGSASEETVLRLAATVERRAHHPVARAIVAAADERGLADAGAISFESITGQGAEAEVGGNEVLVGSVAYVSEHACDPGGHRHAVAELEALGKTVVVVASDSECLGLIVIGDTVRPGAARAMADLKAGGVKRLVMLTGDSPRTATAVAAGLGLDDVLSGLLPHEKVMAVEDLERRVGSVVMVGDGINDAPALAAATVGVAMGAAGSDTAMETADVALLGDELDALPFALGLARATVARIRENIALSIVIKGVFLVLAGLGWATMWMAVFADMGTSLIVTANGMRLLMTNRKGA
jgi:Cd2+/Zn2+-exporting ATPase